MVGAVLVWLPVVAPLALGIGFWFRRGRLLIDFLMPAELFPLILAGGALLLTAALLTKWRVWLVTLAWGGAVALPAGSQGLAVLTGLASGRHPAEGWRFGVVMATFGLFLAAVVALGVAGIVSWQRIGAGRYGDTGQGSA
jgi:hypothetical protein